MNGMSEARQKAIDFMESSRVLNELKDEDWFCVEDALTKLFKQPYDEDDYTPSSTRGDYSPSNPWDAPGMSMKDFI